VILPQLLGHFSVEQVGAAAEDGNDDKIEEDLDHPLPVDRQSEDLVLGKGSLSWVSEEILLTLPGLDKKPGRLKQSVWQKLETFSRRLFRCQRTRLLISIIFTGMKIVNKIHLIFIDIFF
jgi:hypothetical protein